MKAVNWAEATRSADLVVHRYPAFLAEQALGAELDKDQVAPTHALDNEAKRQLLVDTKCLEADEAELLELSIASHLDRAHAIQARLADYVGDPALGAELVALKADFLSLSKRLERGFARVSGSPEPCAAKLSRLRAWGDQLSFAAYALGLWGPGAGMVARAAN